MTEPVGFFAEPAPTQTDVDAGKTPQPTRRRVRLPSVRRIEKETGKPVTGITYGADGSRTFVLGDPDKASGDDFNEWDREYGKPTPKIRQ